MLGGCGLLVVEFLGTKILRCSVIVILSICLSRVVGLAKLQAQSAHLIAGVMYIKHKVFINLY